MRQIPLNIMLNYPVRWDTFKIIRDFVQNFYDSKGCQSWWKDFRYQYSEESRTLQMECLDSSFSYEWLLHIGASTKSKSDSAAGYFGEGFKMAALCAVRDLDWDVTMASDRWKLHVVSIPAQIDGENLDMLAYDVEDTAGSSSSVLTLRNVTPQQYALFQDVLLSFFYPENPLFGEKLFDNGTVAVYTRSSVPIPASLPETENFGKKGGFFCRYQMLGSVPIPFIFAKHDFLQKDRERNTLYAHRALRLLYDITEQVDAATASKILLAIRDKWNAYPETLVDLDSWYYVVCSLIRRISSSEDETRKFVEAVPNLLYTERFFKGNVEKENRRRLARAWMAHQPVNYRIVMEQFRLLGYSSLEEACERDGGFTESSAPTKKEQQYLNILQELAVELFDDFFVDWRQIPCRIIRGKSVRAGEASSLKRSRPAVNRYGMKIRGRLEDISIISTCFNRDGFGKAVSVYLHELSHMFGGDSSAAFSRALTVVMQILADNVKVVEEYRKKWRECDN